VECSNKCLGGEEIATRLCVTWVNANMTKSHAWSHDDLVYEWGLCTMDAAVAAMEMTMNNILMCTCTPWISKSPNHQIAKFRCLCSVFRFSSQLWHSYLGIQAQYSGLCLGTHIQYHIQVFRFRIKNWVYRLADKYKVLTFQYHIHFRIWVRYWGSGM